MSTAVVLCGDGTDALIARSQLIGYLDLVDRLERYVALPDAHAPHIVDRPGVEPLMASDRGRRAVSDWLAMHREQHCSMQRAMDSGSGADVRCSASISQSSFAGLRYRLISLSSRQI